jgi:MarR family transcriptional regulator for hemolysin
MSLKGQRHETQGDLADAIGIEGPTLTHHLNRMEEAGLVTRTRETNNRRVHRVELTTAGEKRFLSLIEVVSAFDRQLRRGLSKSDTQRLGNLLETLRINATDR